MSAGSQPFLTGGSAEKPKSTESNNGEPAVASRPTSNRRIFSVSAQRSAPQRGYGTDLQASTRTRISSMPHRGRNPSVIDGTRQFGQQTLRDDKVTSTGAGSSRQSSRSERRAWGSRLQQGTTDGLERTGISGKRGGRKTGNTGIISNTSSIQRQGNSVNAGIPMLSVGDIQRGLRKVSTVATKPRTPESPLSDGHVLGEEEEDEEEEEQEEQEEGGEEATGEGHGEEVGGVKQRRRGGDVGCHGSFCNARDKKAEELFRGVSVLPGHALCTDPDSVDGTESSLWCGAASSEQDFTMSQPVDRVDWFVSHTWVRDLRDLMFGSDKEYAAYKTAELEGAVNEALAERQRTVTNGFGEEAGASTDSSSMVEIQQSRAKPLTLWIDKRLVVERHMEHFIRNSDGFLVLPSTNYFRRLWCVYEWGCFVATHGGDTLDRVKVCLTWLCGNPVFQIPLLARDIEIMAVHSLRCSESNDRQHLQGVINNKYRAPERFLQMVQVSALCAFTRTCAVLAFDFCTPGVPDVEEAWGIFDRHLHWRHAKFILPWQSVADNLGLHDVSTALGGFWGQLRRSGKMEAEISQPEEESTLFCVSAPSKKRLTILATAAVYVHLAPLVKKARAAALPLGGITAASAYLGKVNLVRRSQRHAASIGSRGNGGVGGRGNGAVVVK